MVHLNREVTPTVMLREAATENEGSFSAGFKKITMHKIKI